MNKVLVSLGLALTAGQGLAATTPGLAQYEITALYELDFVQQTCFISDCSLFDDVYQVGDTYLFSFRIDATEGGSTFSATGRNPVSTIGFRDGNAIDASSYPVTYEFGDDISSPLLPGGGPNDVIALNWDLNDDFGDGSSAGSNGSVVIYGADNWFDTNGGTFDPQQFVQGITGGFLESENDEFYDGSLEHRAELSGVLSEVSIRDTTVGTGATISDPLMPIAPVNPAAPEFFFTVPASDVVPGTPIWIDPDIAIGYTYDIVGADIAEIVAPDFATVPDSDGYIVEIDGVTYALPVGGTLDLVALGLTGVNSFNLLGIDTALGLDPTDPLAFVTGIVPRHVDPNGALIFRQAPIVAPVPVPMTAALLCGGLACLAGLRRRAA